jgi:hypothetical protein
MMKNKILAALSALIILSTTSLSAQAVAASDELHSGAQVTFFPPLGTNGLHASRYTNDFSFNLLVGISKNEKAFAFAGLTNVIRGDASGFQFAGLANHTGGKMSGMQFAGFTNIAGGNVEGFQFAGLGNVTGDVTGFQFGGLFNKVRNVKGVQFAGIVNIADHSDYPIGLVNIIKDGEMSVAIGYNEIGTTSLTFRSGGRVTYGILGAGFNHKVDDSNDAMSLVAGYGAHINILPWLRINNEVTVEALGLFGSGGSRTFKAGYALLPAFRLGHFELFGGPSVNFMHNGDPDMFDIIPGWSLWDKELSANKRQQAHIGWQVGVQYLF